MDKKPRDAERPFPWQYQAEMTIFHGNRWELTIFLPFKAQRKPKYNKWMTLRHKASGTTYVVVDIIQFPSGMIGYGLHSDGYPANLRHFESEVDRNFEEVT